MSQQMELSRQPLLTVSEVATILNVSASCVRELAREGRLKGIKIISDWRFESSAVEELIQRSEYRGHQAHKERLAS